MKKQNSFILLDWFNFLLEKKPSNCLWCHWYLSRGCWKGANFHLYIAAQISTDFDASIDCKVAAAFWCRQRPFPSTRVLYIYSTGMAHVASLTLEATLSCIWKTCYPSNNIHVSAHMKPQKVIHIFLSNMLVLQSYILLSRFWYKLYTSDLPLICKTEFCELKMNMLRHGSFVWKAPVMTDHQSLGEDKLI